MQRAAACFKTINARVAGVIAGTTKEFRSSALAGETHQAGCVKFQPNRGAVATDMVLITGVAIPPAS